MKYTKFLLEIIFIATLFISCGSDGGTAAEAESSSSGISSGASSLQEQQGSSSIKKTSSFGESSSQKRTSSVSTSSVSSSMSSSLTSSKGESSSQTSSSAQVSSSSVAPPWSSGQDWCATAGNCGTFTDDRTVSTYRWTKIQGRKWMADDLNFAMGEGTIALGQTAQVYLYDSAWTSCPVGWHLPTYEEYEELREFAGGEKLAGKALKTVGGWDTWGTDSTYTGVDVFGFHALPAPEYGMSGFSFVDQEEGTWWLSTVQRFSAGEKRGYAMGMTAADDSFFPTSAKEPTRMRVRCVEGKATANRKGSSWCNKSGNCGTFTDQRDGEQYAWTKIGTQQWMAENLNYSGDDGAGNKIANLGWCFGNNLDADSSHHKDEAHCDLYGRLYNNSDAVKVCPAGWRLPTRADYDSLLSSTKTDHAGLAYPIGQFRGKTNNSWGFAALPAGYWDESGEMEDFGGLASFWFQDSLQSPAAETLFEMDFTWSTQGTTYLSGVILGDAHSVRCVKE